MNEKLILLKRLIFSSKIVYGSLFSHFRHILSWYGNASYEDVEYIIDSTNFNNIYRVSFLYIFLAALNEDNTFQLFQSKLRKKLNKIKITNSIRYEFSEPLQRLYGNQLRDYIHAVRDIVKNKEMIDSDFYFYLPHHFYWKKNDYVVVQEMATTTFDQNDSLPGFYDLRTISPKGAPLTDSFKKLADKCFCAKTRYLTAQYYTKDVVSLIKALDVAPRKYVFQLLIANGCTSLASTVIKRTKTKCPELAKYASML